MLNIADLKPGMVVSVSDEWGYFCPRGLVVHALGTLRFVPLDTFRLTAFCPDDVVEVVE